MKVLLPMFKVYMDAEGLVQVFRKMLCAINAAMLSAGTSEGKLQMGKAALNILLNVSVRNLIDVFQVLDDFAILFQELYDGGVKSR